jgi:flagella basal body P-ring formation protein FlgA
MWSSAVVVGGQIKLSDICALDGFEESAERRLGAVVVGETSEPGGSRLIHLNDVRAMLDREGVNMAEVTLRGSMRCAVSRPATADCGNANTDAALSSRATQEKPGTNSARSTVDGHHARSTLSLRHSVQQYFDREFTRYGGRAKVIFDHTSDQVLNLTGPTFQFNVRRRGGASPGLAQLEVDVLTEGRIVQTVPLVAQVTMIRPTLVARRAVNQGATLTSSDVELISMTFTRLDELGFTEATEAIGQRARRMLPAGSVIEPSVLEAVPLVMRGQIVKVISVNSGIEVAMAGKAVQEGLWGEIITVRVGERKGTEVAARVVGPGKVQMGGVVARRVDGETVAKGGVR